jgi:hypothetical protein
MILIVLLFFANLVYSFVDTVVSGCAAVALGIPIQAVNLFTGKKWWVKQLGRVEVSIGLLPLGGHIQLTLQEDYYQPQESEVTLGKSPGFPGGKARYWQDVNPIVRVLFTLIAPFVIWMISAIVMGPEQALASTLRGFHQIIWGAFNPEFADLLLQRGWEIHRQNLQELMELIGLLLTKFNALNLLPLAGYKGDFILRSMGTALLGYDVQPSPRFIIVSMIIMVGMAGLWAIHLLRFTWL